MSPDSRRPITAAILALLLTLAMAGGAAAEVLRFEIDPAHSSPSFIVRHFFSQVHGSFTDFGGTLIYDTEKPENSQIEITIQAMSIDTNNERRDNHLRSADFFDAANHPTLTFRSTKIEPTGQKNVYNVTGDFTARGVTRSISVEVDMLGFADFGEMGYRGGFTAKTTINRKDFGILWNRTLDTGGTMLSDDVRIEFEIEVVAKPA